MDILVVFYSLNGHVKLLSKLIAENFKSTDFVTTVDLKLEKELPKSAFSRSLVVGREFLFNQKPELKNGSIDFSKYDLIFIGTPIWGTIASAMNTLLSENKISGKQIAIFTSCDGGSPNKAYEKMERLLPDSIIVGRINFVNPGPHDIDNIRNSIKIWIKGFLDDVRGKRK